MLSFDLARSYTITAFLYCFVLPYAPASDKYASIKLESICNTFASSAMPSVLRLSSSARSASLYFFKAFGLLDCRGICASASVLKKRKAQQMISALYQLFCFMQLRYVNILMQLGTELPFWVFFNICGN